MTTYKVLLFYRFFALEDVDKLSEQIRNICHNRNLIGRILLANEGINGTLAGFGNSCDDIINDFVKLDSRFQFVDWKITLGENEKLPFPDLYIKIVKELIGTGLLGKDIFDHQKFSNETYGGLETELTGVHLTPQKWHDTLTHGIETTEPIVLLDVRNDIEYQVGHFRGSTNLKTVTYSETWKNIDTILSTTQCDKNSNSKIFMYCTGGIRCEKASAYLIKKGIERERIFQVG